MKIDCEKLDAKAKNELVSKLKVYVVKGGFKLDGEVIRFSDNAGISMGDYFKVCNLLKKYGVELED